MINMKVFGLVLFPFEMSLNNPWLWKQGSKPDSSPAFCLGFELKWCVPQPLGFGVFIWREKLKSVSNTHF